jgi:hypothetical protein
MKNHMKYSISFLLSLFLFVAVSPPKIQGFSNNNIGLNFSFLSPDDYDSGISYALPNSIFIRTTLKKNEYLLLYEYFEEDTDWFNSYPETNIKIYSIFGKFKQLSNLFKLGIGLSYIIQSVPVLKQTNSGCWFFCDYTAESWKTTTGYGFPIILMYEPKHFKYIGTTSSLIWNINTIQSFIGFNIGIRLGKK